MRELLPEVGSKVGGYRFAASLGKSGTHHAVFAALDPEVGRRVVIKTVALGDEEAAGRLVGEFRVLRSAAGSGVVRVLAHGTSVEAGIDYLVLAVHGPSLATLLAASPGHRLSLAEAAAVLLATARALAGLHGRGWAHGDVKPGNVLLGTDGTALLTDLEYAIQVEPAPATPPPLAFPGTVPFVAPELWREGGRARSIAADVWALGVTFYYALAGNYPFGHRDPAEVARAIESDPRGFQIPAGLPGPVSELLASLLEPDPRRRLAHGAAVVAASSNAFARAGLDASRLLVALGERVRVLPATEVLLGPPTVEGLAPEPRRRAPASQAAGADEPEELKISTSVYSPPEPSGAPAAAPEPRSRARDLGGEIRRAAARWFTRMNPGRNFPLSVVLSGKKIRIVDAPGMKVSVGTREIEIDATDPVLEIEPIFAGCLVSPAKARLDVSGQTTVARFWITPLVEGDLAESRIEIRYRTELVESLPTPAKVASRTWTRLCLALSALSPILAQVLQGLGISIENSLSRALPFLRTLADSVGAIWTGVLVFAVFFLAAGFVFHRLSRPLESAEPGDLVARPA